jgi:type IV pilus assembly protein PilM
MLLLKKPNFAIGLDISDMILKAVELKKNKDQIKISAISKYRLKPGVIEQGEIKDETSFLEAVNSLLSKTKRGTFNTNEVVACLPDPKTFIKLVEIEKTPNSLAQVIGAEIEKHVPMPLRDMYYDWQKIEETATSCRVLIGAAPKYIVDQYAQILREAKLSLMALEIESVSIARALLKEETKKYSGPFDKNYCIIDIGAKRTSLMIYSRNAIVSSISLPISGNETTEIISKSLEISNEEAEKAKLICGMDKTQAHGIVNDILTDMVNNLIEKIEIAIDFFSKNYQENNPIHEIILCGGGANIKDLDSIISGKLKIPTRIGSPLSNIEENAEALDKCLSDKSKIETLEDHIISEQNTIVSYTTAIGLALRSVFIDKI